MDTDEGLTCFLLCAERFIKAEFCDSVGGKLYQKCSACAPRIDLGSVVCVCAGELERALADCTAAYEGDPQSPVHPFVISKQFSKIKQKYVCKYFAS